MNAIKEGFRRVYWNGSAYYAPQECYVDHGYEYKFERPAQPDDRANALAVLSGLADESQYPAILEILKKQFNSSPYMEKYVLDAMFFMGYEEEALVRMKTRYQMMIDDEWTTLWENFKTSASTRWGTHNHAWTGGPLINLSGNVAGVAPDAPGYEQYHVLPQLGELNQVSVSVPSVKGDIKVQICRDVEKQEVKITLDSPTNTVARVGIPKFDGKDLTVTVEAGDMGVAYESQDSKYVYYLAQPGHHCFVGK
jgi:hypothetical protein